MSQPEFDALKRVAGRDVPRETYERLKAYQTLVTAEARVQNLVSADTLDSFWDRHILDSAQLVRFARATDQHWADIGAGAGLPGIVIACLSSCEVHLIEPRRLRAAFLSRVTERLGLGAQVHQAKAERLAFPADVITARAVARIETIFEISRNLSTEKTRYVLPKGRSATSELDEAKAAWQGVFHVEQSLTQDESAIVIADQVRRRPR